MERLAEDPTDTLECLGAMAAYHDRQGNHDAVREMKRRADLHDERMSSAMHARNNLTKRDTFLPHGLDEKKIGEIRELLAGEKSVRSAWLVCKEHREFANWKHYVMAVDLRFPWYRFTSDNDVRMVLRRLVEGLNLDGYILVIRDEKENKPICKQIRIQQPQAVIHTVG
ncbi:hypothetical protein OVA24_00480 [Luteolibacter sp. SL250]|uniref:hypothetical protein n=1 Tax=Luteolibacter sp. SL250 TaxID=2995170 RepID=UPI002271B4AC|nr:hypothetical protein [Luteolibacter sp. SL250]WAC19851.1 hypothetical protein OVA24_00480 [Luteolibacter sp. SL250]